LKAGVENEPCVFANGIPEREKIVHSIWYLLQGNIVFSLIKASFSLLHTMCTTLTKSAYSGKNKWKHSLLFNTQMQVLGKNINESIILTTEEKINRPGDLNSW
jgi:hypothetical protein